MPAEEKLIMKTLPIALISILLVPAVAHSQSAVPACDAPEHRQFDFWQGDFEVRTGDAKLAGHNHIESILGGCALQEHWTGAGGGKGRSINFYDRSDGKWHQVWIDARGQSLFLSGKLEGQAMVLEGETRDADGKTSLQRITWTPLPDSRVRQHWQSSEDAGASWTTAFDGYYTRKP
jgi:hypothetical protein